MHEDRKPTKRQRDYINEMISAMSRFEWDMHHHVSRMGRVPAGWRTLWQERDHAKTRVTIRVDADVLRFFKTLGAGHGPRMNTVLRAFMLARLGGLIEGEDLLAEYREEWMGRPKPGREEAYIRFAQLRDGTYKDKAYGPDDHAEDGDDERARPEPDEGYRWEIEEDGPSA